MATVPGFGWWPIKAFRPCPGFLASGGRYRRRGQSMDEVAFGRGKRDIKMESTDKVKSRYIICLTTYSQFFLDLSGYRLCWSSINGLKQLCSFLKGEIHGQSLYYSHILAWALNFQFKCFRSLAFHPRPSKRLIFHRLKKKKSNFP